MREKTFTYVARYSPDFDLGVDKKISEVCSVLRNSDWLVFRIVLDTKERKRRVLLNIYRELLFRRVQVVIIRSMGVLDLFLVPLVLYLRFRGQRVILDFPVPRRVSFVEIASQRIGIRKLLFKLMFILCGPWSYWCYNVLVQYALESDFFLFGNRKRTRLMGNGIDPNRFELRKKCYVHPSKVLYLLGVATLTEYQGYDRVLRAIAKWQACEDKVFDLVFNILGDGPERESLEALAHELGIQDQVIFHGKKEKNELQEFYSLSHLGVGAIGLFRKGVEVSSVLKIREYSLVGLPFIASGMDPDFEEDLPFRYLVNNEDEIESIVDAISLFNNTRGLYSDIDIREYAITKLTHKVKLKDLGINLQQ